ncbi:hypothetical protein DTO021C3_3180 [Paecilomyces variotii]|nr:hypothetical protein DTO021C3_3180 [Paecilomyces variotii]
MRPASWIAAAAVSAGIAHAATLDEVCTTSYAQEALPADGFYQGVTIDPSSVVVAPVKNASVSDDVWYPDSVFDYCDVTFAYSHTARNDRVLVRYWLPAPNKFQNRYLSTGGGGYAINSGNSSLPGGIIYGAVAGATDGGFGSFDTQFDSVWLLANGTANWESLFMFGYEAIHELSVLGKQFTKQFFNMTENDKLYSYYQGCSEGGREGWSQVQRFADEWDGAVTGAPAFRYAFQQIQHLYSNVVTQTLGYYPPQCELKKIVNETIAACDPLDGKTDGVVARSDLCKLHFNITSLVGKPYHCPASAASSTPFPTPATPAQNGTVTAEGVSVASEIIKGLRDSKGRQVYFSYQPAASFSDALTQYNSTTGSWELYVNSFGAGFVTRYLELVNASTLANLDGVTYDTLKNWIYESWQRYEDTLQTTWPDLTAFQEAGGKVLHLHGESDSSIPPASSIRYHESVRSVMYPKLSFNDSSIALADWYRLFLVPGAEHCATNSLQPNGPWPQTTLQTLIDWVEKDIAPETLNGTILQGEHVGESQPICAWPLRPYWSENGTKMECQYDQASIDSWIYDLDAFKLPVY